MNRIKPMVPALMLLAASFLLALLADAVLTSTALAQRTDGSVCPLSDEQTQKSIQAFAKVAQVFTQQPRCVNCHGAVNPFAADAEDKHGGGKLDPIMKTEPDVNTGEPVTTQDDEATFGQCRTCHDAFSEHWHIPPAALFFVGKDAITLCKGQRDTFNFDAVAFLKHIEQDVDPSNPFIQEAFTGRMGLNDVGQSLAKQYPDPPKGVTRQDLIQMAHDWVDANGGKFKGELDCGCVPHHYAIHFDQSGTIDTNRAGMQGHYVNSGNGDIALNFKDDASFEDQASVATVWNIKVSGNGITCTAKTPQSNQIQVTGNVDDDLKMHLKFSWTASEAKYSDTCTSPVGKFPFNGTAPGIDSPDPSSELAGGFEMQALVGETKSFMVPVPFGKFTYTITIKQID